MAEEKEAKPARKPKKTAVPEAPPEPPKDLPTPTEIRAARKADLVAWSERFGLSVDGKVDELRKRLVAYLEKEARREAGKEEAEKPPEKVPEEKPPEKKPKEAKKAEKPKKTKKPAKPETKGEAEEEEERVHEARAKPKLDERVRRLLAIRSSKNMRRPRFRRQEWFRYRKFGNEWRRPQGGQSKLRRHFGYRWNVPSIGYRGPRGVRGLHPSGFQEVLVHNERQLEGLNSATQAVRIAHGVGARKRDLIEKACDDKGLRVLNRMVTE